MQGWVVRSFLNAEEFAGRLLDVEDHAVAMELLGVRQRFEDEKIECSLQIVFGHFKSLDNLATGKITPRSLGVSRKMA